MTITRFSARIGLFLSVVVLQAATPTAQAPALPNPAAPAQAPAPQRPSVRTRRTDGRAVDGPRDAVRHHANRDHQSRDRGRGRRAAARNPDRRQEAGNGQPHRLVLERAQTVRRGGRTGGDHARAASSGAVSRRGHHRWCQRRSARIVGPGVQHGRDAARRRNRHCVGLEAQDHQHAASAWRQREPAGDVAGAVRRSEPPGADRARTFALRAAQPASPRDPRRSNLRLPTSTQRQTGG